jgi:hypothetical protein
MKGSQKAFQRRRCPRLLPESVIYMKHFAEMGFYTHRGVEPVGECALIPPPAY